MLWRLLRLIGIYPMFRTRGHVSAVRFGKPDAQGEARRWFSWQSLNECECGRELSPIPHGRAWFHFGDNGFGWSWRFGRWNLGASLTMDAYGADHELSGHLMLPLVAFYWHLDHACPSRWRKQFAEWWKSHWGYDGRVVALELHHGSLWGKCWAPENEWSASQPKWMDWSFDFADFFLGPARHSEVTLKTVQGDLHLPEGDYPTTVRLYESTWKRARWPFPKRIKRADVQPERPIPVPGKGENAWDCEDTAVYSLTCPAETAEEAGDALVKRVQETRERHGGSNWRPQEKVAA